MEALLDKVLRKDYEEEISSIPQNQKCTLCEYMLFVTDEGLLACSNSECCIIVTDIVDFTAEWRYYGADDNHHTDPARCGMPINPLLHESSFGCRLISTSGGFSYELGKIKRYIEWQSMPYKEKSQNDEFQRITMMSQISGIPKLIIDDAVKCHKKISEYELTFRGDNRDGILAASIYMSCKMNNYPRTAKEISKIFHLDPSSATRGCKNAQLIMSRLEKDLETNEKTILHKTTPECFINRFCSTLMMNAEHINLCKFVCMKIQSNEFMPENNPQSIAAGVIFFVGQLCKLTFTKKDVRDVSNISEVTITKCYKKIDQIKTELIPPIILGKYS